MPQDLRRALEALPPSPRIVASGNFATPTELLALMDRIVPAYRLHMLNAQPGIPEREGVTHETGFVGPGMRSSASLRYVPTRLSLLPRLFSSSLPPDVVVVHTSLPRGGVVSLGTEVNVLPAAIEAVRRLAGPSTSGESTSPSALGVVPA